MFKTVFFLFTSADVVLIKAHDFLCTPYVYKYVSIESVTSGAFSH